MRKFFYILLILISNCIFSQNNFEINLNADSYENDSLILGAASTRRGWGDLYTFTVQSDKNITVFPTDHSLYTIRIKKENLIKGFTEYPQPVAFTYLDKKNKSFSVSKTFFIEKGKHRIELPTFNNQTEINIDSPTNRDFKNLQKALSTVYIKSTDPQKIDSLTNFDEKQKLLVQYIKKNPDSYAALWEIVNDYRLYNFHSIYLENMKFFSPSIKKNTLYKKLVNKLLTEQKTLTGNNIPDIYFDKSNKLTAEDFKNHKLTFIDYWATSCAPCVKGMPEIVNLYHEFKDKGVQFITVTDEQKPERIKLAQTILQKNNATWLNFFDTNKDFQKKLNVSGYPMHLLIDENGKILARIMGDLSEVRNKITEYVK
ncbi:TlpA disulfide reductase family protein [Chryseobacterium sp. MYb264]|uniref:TlpA family protein disulfide reductase n=1 Tax=Chryseobacterium sp. MYb264 TaxID=2745153 RepID=UPI002E1073C4|nr:TlpA disulfide reductase family protein [Chryseobacterium sp. MYb264]